MNYCKCCGEPGELDKKGLCIDCELMKKCRGCGEWVSMFDLDLSGYCLDCWIETGAK